MPITGGAPAVPVSVRAYRTEHQAIPTAEWTSIVFQAQRWDDPNDDQWAVAPNPTRLTCRHAGMYVLWGGVRWDDSDVGQRLCWIYLNGTTIIAMHKRTPSAVEWLTISSIYKLAVGNWVELQVYQDTGGNLNIQATAEYSPEFAMARVG